MLNYIWITLIGFLFVTIWMFIFKQSYKNTYIKNKISLLMSSIFGVSPSYAYSLFATIVYCALPVAFSLILAIVGRVRWRDLFNFDLRITSFIIIILLCFIAAISIISICIIFIQMINPKINIAKEMSSIRWIEGIFQFPKKVAWVLPMLSACFEEIFFRGVFLASLINSGLNDLLALSIVTIFFIINQCVLADTREQKLILGMSSFSISLTCGLAFFVSGSILPSIVVHAAFAGFYINGNEF